MHWMGDFAFWSCVFISNVCFCNWMNSSQLPLTNTEFSWLGAHNPVLTSPTFLQGLGCKRHSESSLPNWDNPAYQRYQGLPSIARPQGVTRPACSPTAADIGHDVMLQIVHKCWSGHSYFPDCGTITVPCSFNGLHVTKWLYSRELATSVDHNGMCPLCIWW